MKSRLLAIAACAAFTCAAVAADTGARTERFRSEMQRRFAAADQDGDGRLSQAEADRGMPRIAQAFADIDTDHDGFVTQAEIGAYLQQRMAARTPRQRQ